MNKLTNKLYDIYSRVAIVQGSKSKVESWIIQRLNSTSLSVDFFWDGNWGECLIPLSLAPSSVTLEKKLTRDNEFYYYPILISEIILNDEKACIIFSPEPKLLRTLFGDVYSFYKVNLSNLLNFISGESSCDNLVAKRINIKISKSDSITFYGNNALNNRELCSIVKQRQEKGKVPFDYFDGTLNFDFSPTSCRFKYRNQDLTKELNINIDYLGNFSLYLKNANGADPYLDFIDFIEYINGISNIFIEESINPAIRSDAALRKVDN